MGSFTSKDFEDLVEAPNTPLSGKRVLEFDPRSPSVGICRTPIQVEKTPDRLIDPRSPTCGIFRTPILDSDIEPQSLRYGNTVPASGSPGSIGRQRRHSFSEGSPVHFDPTSVTDVLASLPPLDLDMEDCTDDVRLLQRSTSEPDLSFVQDNNVESQPQKEAEYKIHIQSVRHRKPKMPKVLFQAHTDVAEACGELPRSPLRIFSDSQQRSPLSKRNNIDINSPRNIVQRKQSNKLGMLKTRGGTPVKSAGNSPCRVDAMAAGDKENVSM